MATPQAGRSQKGAPPKAAAVPPTWAVHHPEKSSATGVTHKVSTNREVWAVRVTRFFSPP